MFTLYRVRARLPACLSDELIQLWYYPRGSELCLYVDWLATAGMLLHALSLMLKGSSPQAVVCGYTFFILCCYVAPDHPYANTGGATVVMGQAIA